MKEEERLRWEAQAKADEDAAKDLMQQKDTATKLQRDRSRTNSLHSKYCYDQITLGKTVSDVAAYEEEIS